MNDGGLLGMPNTLAESDPRTYGEGFVDGARYGRRSALDEVYSAVRSIWPKSRLVHKADDNRSSYDPLARETEVLAAIDALRKTPDAS